MAVKQTMALLVTLVVGFGMVACQEADDTQTEVDIESIAVDLDTVQGDFFVDDFDFSEVTLIVTNSDGTTLTLSLSEAMLDSEGLAKLTTPGTHTILVRYEGKTVTFQVTLIAPTTVEEEGMVLTLVFSSDGGDEVNPMEILTVASTVELPIPVKAGYVFDGWYIDDALTTPFDLHEHFIDGTITVYASWIPIEDATVMFSVLGEIIASEPVSATGTVSFPDNPDLALYVFDGWYLDDAFEHSVDASSMFTKDVTLFAKFVYDPARGSVMEAFYLNPPDEQEAHRFNDMLVVDVINILGMGIRVVILTDFTYYPVLFLQSDEVAVGDIISFDTLVNAYDHATTYGNNEIMLGGAKNLTVESSGNPVLPPPVQSLEDRVLQNETFYPGYTAIAGVAFYQGEGRLLIVDPDTLVYVEMITEKTLEPFDGPRLISTTAYFVSFVDSIVLHHVTMAPIELDEGSDEDILNRMEAFIRGYWEGKIYQSGNILRSSISRALQGSMIYAFDVNDKDAAYFDADENRFAFTDAPRDVRLDITLEINGVTRVFQVTLALEPPEVSTIAQVIQNRFGDHRLYMEGTVIVDYGRGIVVHDGTDMIDIMMPDRIDTDDTMTLGHTYVFVINPSYVNMPSRFIQSYESVAADLGPSDLTIAPCDCTLDDLDENHDVLWERMTIEGTLVAQPTSYFEFIYVDTGTHKVYLTRLSSSYHDYLLENHLGETVELDVLVSSYIVRVDQDGMDFTGFYAAVLHEDSYAGND